MIQCGMGYHPGAMFVMAIVLGFISWRWFRRLSAIVGDFEDYCLTHSSLSMLGTLFIAFASALGCIVFSILFVIGLARI